MADEIAELNIEKKSVAFFTYKRTDGFEVSLTIRGDSGTEVLEAIDKAITKVKGEGAVPAVKSFGSKPQVPTKPCPVHNLPMKEKKKADGTVFYSHSRGIYPNLEYCNGRGFPDEL